MDCWKLWKIIDLSGNLYSHSTYKGKEGPSDTSPDIRHYILGWVLGGGGYNNTKLDHE